ncbi:TetR/AcrR family transcriptional regulator [Candidatus Pantoea floridensis]|uniref:Transcriptional regulator, TetR family n=1 Tax=Candidatus Pantoea floridensis TaxID=1938870 RepID=A0A286BLP4_9GAMM|nr:TetR/AcrR family transcriptional regulator [Pantoea floridensis]PIF22348.1 TetR family transcriptional regulator [Enterobacteriaceae bacterium JKS000233]SOD35065.1 transcriptional regulator, TetR family [Pantoea floridensis]
MNKTSQRIDTREHLLATGEQVCLQRGFTGMGLIEMLALADVTKGSFYHYFRSKEAFGVALLERYFANFLQQIEQQLNQPGLTPTERLLQHFRYAETLFIEQGHIVGCLGVKLSAEVCDLSEPMRDALQHGANAIIAAYTRCLTEVAAERPLPFNQTPQQLAQRCYLLWLGASLQSKISREPGPISLALETIEQWLISR